MTVGSSEPPLQISLGISLDRAYPRLLKTSSAATSIAMGRGILLKRWGLHVSNDSREDFLVVGCLIRFRGTRKKRGVCGGMKKDGYRC